MKENRPKAPSVIAVDWPLSIAVRQLLDASTLAERVEATERDSIVGKTVVEFQVNDLPVEMWSSGERVLWDFLVAVAGQGEVNLATLGGYWRGDERMAPYFVSVFALVLGINIPVEVVAE